jgi:cytochrome c oxidase cbb3-type subunit II
MPSYPWLQQNVLDGRDTARKMTALRRLGVPYTDEDIAGAQAAVQGVSEMDAIIAYLQHLGTVLSDRR